MVNELHEPVIEIGAKTCGNQIAKRCIRNSYRNRPDLVDIMGELFDAHHNLYGKEE